jgi:hypothetical protein
MIATFDPKNIYKKFSAVNFFQFFFIKPWIWIRICIDKKCWFRIHIWIRNNTAGNWCDFSFRFNMPGDSDIGGLTLRDLYCSERKAREQRLSYLRYRTQLSRESLPEEEERVGLKCEIPLTKNWGGL